MLKKVCSNIQKNDLVFNNNIYDDCISPCCYDFKNKISITIDSNFTKTYEKTLKMISLKKEQTEEELKKLYPDCFSCKYRTEENIIQDNIIHFVNLSLYPSPCQCNCIYCDIKKDKKMMTYKNEDLKQYEIVFKTLENLIENKQIATDSIWQVSCGEITIHPLKAKIYNFTKNKKVTYYTNCCKYDEELAKILEENKKAKINFSIDCGNEDTWRKIKGLNNYEKTLEILKSYIKKSSPEQIELKYILLEGINDDDKNFQDLIEIMIKSKLNKLIITRNYDDKITKKIIDSKEKLIKLVKENDIKYEISSF